MKSISRKFIGDFADEISRITLKKKSENELPDQTKVMLRKEMSIINAFKKSFSDIFDSDKSSQNSGTCSIRDTQGFNGVNYVDPSNFGGIHLVYNGTCLLDPASPPRYSETGRFSAADVFRYSDRDPSSYADVKEIRTGCSKTLNCDNIYSEYKCRTMGPGSDGKWHTCHIGSIPQTVNGDPIASIQCANPLQSDIPDHLLRSVTACGKKFYASMGTVMEFKELPGHESHHPPKVKRYQYAKDGIPGWTKCSQDKDTGEWKDCDFDQGLQS